MSYEDESHPNDEISVVDDFSIADALQESLIRQLRDEFSTRGEDRVAFRANHEQLESWLGESLSERQVEALWVGLSANGAAKEIPTGRTYVEYDFRIDTEAAVRVLNQQIIAARYRTKRPISKGDEVDLIATIPDPIRLSDAESVSYTGGRVRDLVLSADESVCLANPYFDAEQAIVEDLASLPRRGVKTRILTRETVNPDRQLAEALNKLYRLSASSHERLLVRDLYESNEVTGRQRLATHAKLIIIDDTYCYVGSANLTHHSLSNNFEFGLLLSGDKVDRVAAVFDNVFEYAVPVDLPLSPES